MAIILQGGNRIAGGLLVLLGAWWLGDNLGLAEFDLADAWPLALVAIGLVLVYRALAGETKGVDTGSDSAGRLRALGIFSTATRRITGRLDGGDATAFFGGCEIDLTEADITDEAALDLLAICGGIEIYVPPDCGISGGPIAFMGGYEDGTVGGGPAAHFLRLRGFTMWGGIEVKNRPVTSSGDASPPAGHANRDEVRREQ